MHSIKFILKTESNKFVNTNDSLESMKSVVKFFSVLYLLGFSIAGHAQHRIEFNIDNYENDSLIVGYYLMDKQLVHDTLFSVETGKFVLEDTLDVGVYLSLTLPDQQFLQFVVNDFEKEFSMSFDYQDKTHVIFEGSEDNTAFQSHLNFLKSIRPLADSLKQEINAIEGEDPRLEPMKRQLDSLNALVALKQDSMIAAHPDFMSTVLLKANKEIEMPEFGASEEEQMKQYRYFKAHYFDHIDLGDPRVLRTPFLYHRVKYYVDKLTPAHPDSVSQSIDSIMHWMSPSEDSYRVYLSHFLNSYIKAKIVGYDAVYVHLVDNYYAKGKTPWVQEENILKILDHANKLRPVLIGETGADIKVFKEDGTPVSISDIDYEYLVLLFWAPDCGHCKKSMPDFVEFNEKYAELGVKTFAICTKYRDKVKGCWESVKEKNMTGFINAADEFNRSGFKVKYFVDSTPKVYILDKNREILMKNIGAHQLDAVFEQILSRKNEATEISDQ